MSETTIPQTQALPPPTEGHNLFGWAHKNLFSSWGNTLLTFLSLGLIFALLKSILTRVFTQARWEVIQVNFRLLMVGQYPAEELWRVWLCVYVLVALIGLTWGIWLRRQSDRWSRC